MEVQSIYEDALKKIAFLKIRQILMLSAIRKIFSIETEQDDSINAADLKYNLINPHFITQPARIITLLQQVIVSPPLCSVTLANSKQTFLTSILGVLESQGLLIFDKLAPAEGNNLLVSSRQLKISTTLNGVPLTFNLEGIGVGKSEHSVFYKAYLPERIYYPQRRSSPRIATQSTDIGFQGTSLATKMIFAGYVFDFSRSGIGINLHNGQDNILRGDTLTNCLVVFPDNHSLSFDLAVRSLKKPDTVVNPRNQIGGCFDNLSPRNQKKIERYISALERAQIRKLKN